MYEIYFVLYYIVYLFALMTYDWHLVYDNVFVGFFLWLLLYNLRSKASKYIPSAPAHERNSSIDLFDGIFWVKDSMLLLGAVAKIMSI